MIETSEYRETESFDFEGPAGRIEAILNRPREVRAAAVICHAHPLHGGMMHFKVIFRAAKALQAHGVAVLRFNFRGVGRSEGIHDHGRGEQEDARSALREIGRRFPGVPKLIGGFSFGAAMAAAVSATEGSVRATLLLGYPITRVASHEALGRLSAPCLLVQGEHDEFGRGAAMVELARTIKAPYTVAVIEGADHFFTGALDQLHTRIESWASTGPWTASDLTTPAV